MIVQQGILPPSPRANSVIGTVKPWSQAKSIRGCRKTISSDGYACDHPGCLYHGITDSTLHALVGDGHHGTDHDIQDFLCQACHHKFSARRHTSLSHLKNQPQSVAQALTAIAEGRSTAAAVRVFGYAEATIFTWLCRAGMHSQHLHQQTLHHLNLEHVQLDELRATVRSHGHEVRLWLALHAHTKLIAAAQLGPHT